MSTVKVDTIEPRTASSTITIGAAANNLTTITSAASITMDLNNNNNFKVELDHNATFNNPSNPTAGQTGSIFITQGSTGGTASWGTSWDFIGGTAPTLTTTAAATDRIDYIVLDSTNIQAVATLNYS
tara:strand:+ start:1767 stop:2147 length:381 start_codon:yes stop_codon:yes gene_type:complete